MDIDSLRDQTVAYLALRWPALQEGAPRLVDECLASARQAFRNEFICQLGPQAWARITLIYFKHFLDTGCDVTVGEIFASVIRDSINLNRLDLLTQELAQQKQAPAEQQKKPSLKVIKQDET